MQVDVNTIRSEWEMLNKFPTTCNDTNYATAKKNTQKNRYSDVLALEKTRVLLKSGEYINANYVDISPAKYKIIATQSPLPTTFDSFWEMAYENGVAVIIMLTRLIEKGMQKADNYWPEDGQSIKFNNIVIAALGYYSLSPGIMVRKFQMIKNTETRIIYHISFFSWPDFGAPSGTEEIRLVYHHAKSLIPQKLPCPFIVHCSAGIGRAGSFISYVYFCESWLNNFGPISLPKIVSDLRQQRMSMVQSFEQYSFIYSMIYDEYSSCTRHYTEDNSSRPPNICVESPFYGVRVK